MTESSPAAWVVAHNAPWRRRWDFAVFLTVVVVCVTVPLRVGFLLRDWVEWVALDCIIVVVFIADTVLSSRTTFDDDGKQVTEPLRILQYYLRSWLIPDVVSLLPLELFSFAVGQYEPAFIVNRLLRAGHLVHYLRMWEEVSTLKPSVVRILKAIFAVLFLAHLCGCLFQLVVLLEGDDAKPAFTGSDDFLLRSFASRYLRSFYWAFVTMTGYNNTDPQTQAEAFLSIFVTLIGIAVFASIIGTVGSLVSNLDSSKLYFRQRMEAINEYMAYKRIPHDLQEEVRDYYQYLWKSGKGMNKVQVLEDLPPYLKVKMSTHLNAGLIQRVPLFASCKDDLDFVTEVVKSLRTRICLPNSYVVRKGEVGTEMFFVSRGEVNVMNDEGVVVVTLKEGQFLGEIAVIYDTKRTATVIARTYCDMLVLTKEDLRKVLRRFPEQAKEIERVAEERYQLQTKTVKSPDADATVRTTDETNDDGTPGKPSPLASSSAPSSFSGSGTKNPLHAKM